MEMKRTKKELIAVCLLVLSLVLITVGTTFAFFTYSRKGTTENKVQTGNLTFVYDEKRIEKNGVSLSNAFPMSDEEGQALDKDQNEVFDFDVRAKTQGADINYEIYLTKEEGSTLPEYVVKTYLKTVSGEDESNPEKAGLPTGTNLNLYSALWDSQVPSILKNEEITNAKTLYRETIANGSEDYTKTFRYRMWIDEDANKVINGSWKYNNKTFSVKVNVYAQNETITGPTEPEVYKDESGANYPELVEGLIPVRYDTNKKSWVKADLYKEWYDYDNQEWANAVTVVEHTESESGHDRVDYQQAEAGTPILMDDINTMWVWIPRYEYDYVNIQTAGGTQSSGTYGSEYLQPGEIKIKFISKNVTSPTENNYKVHPAFTFDNEQLEGIWYGKFEPSNEEGKYENNSSLTPIIKPNIPSWRNINISNAFYASLSMNSTKASKYGFSGDGSIDTHMSKNSEWGSVAYLSQSKYGKNGNNNYGADEKEVYINNCSSYITGIAGDTANAEQSTTCTNTYDTIQGQKASTTGNITGIYDMSGGAWERVMGALEKDNTGKPTTASSGFVEGESGNKIPDAKYYDLYSGNDVAKACSNDICYGHALSETSGWYGDYHSSGMWLNRGGGCGDGAEAGVFDFGGTGGGLYVASSFRLALVNVGV